MSRLPEGRNFPVNILKNLRVKDIKPIILYHNALSPNNIRNPNGHKSSLVEDLRQCLITAHIQRNRDLYEKLVGYIGLVSRRRPNSHLFTRFSEYAWHDSHYYPIPTTGPWEEHDRAHNGSVANAARFRETIGVPSAVPGGLVNAQYLSSPAAPYQLPAAALPVVTPTELANIAFNEYGLLFPKENIAAPFTCPASPSRMHSKAVMTKLTEDQLDLLRANADDSEKEKYGIHLYIASAMAYAADRRQTPSPRAHLYLPQQMHVKVNGTYEKTLLQPVGSGARPIDLTELFQKTSGVANRVDINYTSTTPLIAALSLTTRHTPHSMANKIRKANLATVDQVRQQFFGKQSSDDDDVIAEGALVNLKCPLGLCRIKVPCRSQHCQHSQCFDCATFLQFYSKAALWKCPVCSANIKSWRELIVDGYFEDILQRTTENDEQVYVEPNGDWRLKRDVEGLGAIKSKPGDQALNVDTDDAIDLSDTSDPENHYSGRNKRQRTDFVDLTLDSDSDAGNDDELPPMTQEELDMISTIEDDLATDTSQRANGASSASAATAASSAPAQPPAISAPAASQPITQQPTTQSAASWVTHLMPGQQLTTSPATSQPAPATTSASGRQEAGSLALTTPIAAGQIALAGTQPAQVISCANTASTAALESACGPAFAAFGGIPPPGTHGPYISSVNGAVSVSYTYVPSTSSPTRNITTVTTNWHGRIPTAEELANIRAILARTTGTQSALPTQNSAVHRLAGPVPRPLLPAAGATPSLPRTPVQQSQRNGSAATVSRSRTQPSTPRPRTASKHTTTSGRKSGSASVGRRSVGRPPVRAPAATVNTTVAGMEITGSGARAAQLRRSRSTVSTASTASTASRSASGIFGTNTAVSSPTLSQSAADLRTIGLRESMAGTVSSVPGLATTTSPHTLLLASSPNALTAGITTTPLQSPRSTGPMTSPLQSSRSPLVGMSPTYSSLFMASTNGTPTNGTAGARNAHASK